MKFETEIIFGIKAFRNKIALNTLVLFTANWKPGKNSVEK